MMRRIGSAIVLVNIGVMAVSACTAAQPAVTPAAPAASPTTAASIPGPTVAPEPSPTDALTAAPETTAPAPTSGPITEPPTEAPAETAAEPTEPAAPTAGATEPTTGSATGAPPSFVIPSFPVVSFPPFTTGQPCPITAQLPRRVLGGQIVYITLTSAQMDQAFVERLEQQGISAEDICFVAGSNPGAPTFAIFAYQAQGASSTQIITALGSAGATPVRLGDRVVLQMECTGCPTEGMSFYAYAIEDAVIAFNATADEADDIVAALP
jgi:hypothetical protein